MKPRLSRVRKPVVHPAENPRAGWAEAFRAMARRGDDALLDGETLLPTVWDNEEWIWEQAGEGEDFNRATKE